MIEAPALQMRESGLDDVEVRADVHGPCEVPLVVVDLFQRGMVHLKRGVAHEDVEVTELARHPVHDRPAMLGARDVTGEQECASPLRFDEVGRLPSIVVLVEVADRDIGPLASERECDRLADTAVASRYECDLALEAPCAPVAVLAVVGSRIHLPVASGNLLLLRWLAHAFPLAR